MRKLASSIGGTRVIGDVREDNEKLVSVSPARNAAAIRAPVLLVHGSEDTTVPIEQSETMRGALRRADREVELVRINGATTTSTGRRPASRRCRPSWRSWRSTSGNRGAEARVLGDFAPLR